MRVFPFRTAICTYWSSNHKMSQVVASGWEGPGWSPALVAEVQLEILGKRSKQRTAPLWAAQLAWAIVRDDLKGHTLAYSGGSVRQRQGSASAGAMLGEVTRQALL